MAAKKKTITKTKAAAVQKKSDKKSTTGVTESTEKDQDTTKAPPAPKSNATKKNEPKKIIPETKSDQAVAEEERIKKEAEEKLKAQEAAEKAEQERIKKEAEEILKAQEAAEKAEQERIKKEAEEKLKAQEAAERVAKIHRIIKEIAEREANEATLAESSSQDLNRAGTTRKKPIAAIFAAISFALILSMMITSSFNNSSKYYIRDTKIGLEIWKGQFAPKGIKKVVFLNGLDHSVTKEIYSKDEVLPIAFSYYLNMADTLIKAKSTPDFETITNFVEKASKFATTLKDKNTITIYRTSIKEAQTRIKTTRVVVTPEALEEKTVPALTQKAPEKKSSEPHN